MHAPAIESLVHTIRSRISQVVVGQEVVVERLLVALLSSGQFDVNFPFLWPALPGSPNGKNGIDPTGNDPYKAIRLDE